MHLYMASEKGAGTRLRLGRKKSCRTWTMRDLKIALALLFWGIWQFYRRRLLGCTAEIYFRSLFGGKDISRWRALFYK